VSPGGPSLYRPDVSCCWQISTTANGNPMPMESCQKVRQDPYPYIAEFSYLPDQQQARQERVSIFCCQDPSLAPGLCTDAVPSYRGKATVTVTTGTGSG
jgi:hypothetical protein